MLIPSKIKQVSSLKGHPFYREDAHLYLPTVDGVIIDYAIVADAINGYVKFIVVDGTTNVAKVDRKRNRPVYGRRKGLVVIMEEKDSHVH